MFDYVLGDLELLHIVGMSYLHVLNLCSLSLSEESFLIIIFFSFTMMTILGPLQHQAQVLLKPSPAVKQHQSKV